MTDALGHVTIYTYEPTFNMMTSMTDPRGRTATYTIDPATGNRTQETDPLGQTSKWTYDSHGNVLTATDKDGHTTTYQYHAFGDLAKTTDPLSNVTTMTYDAVGNRLSSTDADGNTTDSPERTLTGSFYRLYKRILRIRPMQRECLPCRCRTLSRSTLRRTSLLH
jgi:YD repeat-containing protein